MYKILGQKLEIKISFYLSWNNQLFINQFFQAEFLVYLLTNKGDERGNCESRLTSIPCPYKYLNKTVASIETDYPFCLKAAFENYWINELRINRK
ncbi:hypothetical protein B0I18_11313 [Taibaiella chishuiensis]|uniref:Uncharacterized protein n=1 Tax=Taibaiella chishuiensis TaxID=1434707 RepID=A0A2P8CVL5_9BACT|nr:hypothetical protein B0I18_11313 [Taibaiella chishuiensis]